MEGNKLNVSQTSETAEKIKNCFTEKLKTFENNHKKFLFDNSKRVGELYLIFYTDKYIEYKFLDPIKKLDDVFQKEAELFFNEALKGCLDKYS
jgi:hypothetical protein